MERVERMTAYLQGNVRQQEITEDGAELVQTPVEK